MKCSSAWEVTLGLFVVSWLDRHANIYMLHTALCLVMVAKQWLDPCCPGEGFKEQSIHWHVGKRHPWIWGYVSVTVLATSTSSHKSFWKVEISGFIQVLKKEDILKWNICMNWLSELFGLLNLPEPLKKQQNSSGPTGLGSAEPQSETWPRALLACHHAGLNAQKKRQDMSWVICWHPHGYYRCSMQKGLLIAACVISPEKWHTHFIVCFRAATDDYFNYRFIGWLFC